MNLRCRSDERLEKEPEHIRIWRLVTLKIPDVWRMIAPENCFHDVISI